MWVPFLGREIPLEEGMATHSNILVWGISMDRGVWQAAIHRAAQSWTGQQWLSMHACMHTVKGFSMVSEAEVDVFLKFSCFFYGPVDVGNLISSSSAFSKSNLYIWKFSVHILLKPSLKDFKHDSASMWNECNCMLVWTFFAIARLWNLNENWPFSVLWPLLGFPNFLAY